MGPPPGAAGRSPARLENGLSRSIQRIYVERAVADHERTRRVLARFPRAERIACERVVLCSNIWAPILCQKLGVE